MTEDSINVSTNATPIECDGPCVDGAVDGSSVTAEQGPEVLVDLGYGAPPWVQLVLFAIAFLVVGLAGVSIHRNGLDPEVLEEIGEIGLIVFGILIATKSLVAIGAFPYAVDVLGGTAIGFLAAKGLVTLIRRQTSDR